MPSFAEEIVRLLQNEAQCQKAFGVSGGYIYGLWLALHSSPMNVYHCRSEAGAIFSAMEYSLHTNSVGVTFVTCGPGITNTYTGLRAARADGAKMVLLSAITSENEVDTPKEMQETTADWISTITNKHSFQYPLGESIVVRHRGDLIRLEESLRALKQASAGGCLGVFVSLAVQQTLISPLSTLEMGAPGVEQQRPPKATLGAWAHYLSSRLQKDNCIIWAGSGAKEATVELRKIVEHYGTPVMTTPRAKGVFPENHPLCLGCTGTWGNVTIETLRGRLNAGGVVIVLGSRLESVSSAFLQLECMAHCEVITVDLHPGHLRRNLPPHAAVIEAEIKEFLRLLARGFHPCNDKAIYQLQPYSIPRTESTQADRLHPVSVMSVVQEIVVDRHNYMIIGDTGNTLSWTIPLLRINQIGRFRISTHELPMGLAACGAVGIAASGTPVLAIVGDGAMLLQNEVSTAVHHRLPVIWLVLNDALYNMCKQGMDELGASGPDCAIPETDFAQYGQALGARGLVVRSITQLEIALQDAIREKKPIVIDARIDGSVMAPGGSRVASLADV